ncbi:efflux transporter periplasmic adaptor subunit [Idiomarina tyrosinivorans]|uniref:Efflux transporter periplasmic adaptor subunit n=1 Tax=Idiomarina tyrosinivorans TaxID=1445662 RepID=A0A432ZTK3_9GAMM|nr:efflux RND transporter periplasmic adaptor subunit [Idiomarina tyrosinivorans]RUO81213.1 efflux transporter periplasmic adaptor subunit [Idiomarina tyrosinivorans]
MQQRRLIATAIAAAVAATTLVACGDASQNGAGQQGQQQAMEVGVVTLQPSSVELATELPGRTAAYRVAEVRPQVSGILLERNFEEGAHVEAGQSLYQIDPGPYKAELESAKAEVERAQAMLKTADLRYSRFQNLIKDNAISQQEYDEAQANYLEAKAAVSVAEANLTRARINMQYTQVKAPISGQIGRSNFTEGALVTASQTAPLAVIQQLDPIYVDISQSSREFLKLKQEIEEGHIEGTKNGNAVVQLMVDNIGYHHAGELLFSEVSVDEDTGAISLRAKFPNPEHDLLPGMFVRAKVTEGTVNGAIVAPQEGVSRDVRGRPIAFVVNDKGQVERRELTISRALGNKWLVEDGLNAGDKLIVAGLQKIRPGMPVKPVDANANQQAQ